MYYFLLKSECNLLVRLNGQRESCSLTQRNVWCLHDDEEHKRVSFLGNIRVDRECLKNNVSKRLTATWTKGGREIEDERLNLFSLGFHI